MSESPDTPVADGRVLRGERNRALIVDAIIALIREGVTMPTSEQIARRARVGARSLFRHFDDMEGLYVAVNQRMADEILPLFGATRFEGGLRSRIGAMIRCRAEVFERIAPFRRRETSREAASPVIRAATATLNARLREQLRTALAPELEKSNPDLIEALDVLLSWESWNRMRSIQRLGRERSARLLVNSSLRLISADGRRNP